MRIIVAFFLIAALSSCTLAPRKPVAVPSVTTDELLAVLAENAASFSSLKGKARISYREEGRKTVKARNILVVAKPHYIRSEILGLFNQPAAVVAVNGDVLHFLVPGEGVLYRGEASAGNLQRILRIPLQVNDLVNFILYEIPLIEYRSSSLSITENGSIRLLLEGKSGLQEELFFDREKNLTGVRFKEAKKEILNLAYADFSAGEKPFPHHLVLKLPVRGAEAQIHFSSLDTNVGPDDELFHLKKPEGFELRQLP
jgi:hypothetical protein